MKKISEQDDKNYLISTIAYSAAPTITKEKSSSLVVFNNRNNRNLYKYWEKYKEEIKEDFSIKFHELKKTEKITAVLFYNKEKLEKILKEKRNINFLKRFGYAEKMNLQECLELLHTRYEHVCPHEMGIFLGYPVEDVIEFVDCPNKQCLLRGYWKVYHDTERAKDIFERYDKAKYKIMNLAIQGIKPYRIMNAT
ncbi:DUF3793 family protein [Clostridium aestuarii]|uniref:DUF3793 family protein n=1 Tax=Clostridium aestuarii TaxID=338193 RepID=A0ABT4D2H3_9CLOT|nr:DUF3793 family protein [Clostridium aestuarii]MCY6484475.1 DUF3793 family protein [Clostridium aestuarii]